MARVRMGLRLLETLTSALYDDPIILFREYIQNSVDAYNDTIKENPSKKFDGFYIDININKSEGSIIIKDNGYGIANEKFAGKMTDIGASDKSDSPDQIGFRGIGRLSGMPFCDKLIFKNKTAGLDKCSIFIWNGALFHELLNKENEIDLNAAIDKITSQTEEIYNGDKDDHFFIVELEGYKEEISELLKQDDFTSRLQMMLPLKYDPEFTFQDEILKKYSDFMSESLNKFSFIVKLDGKELYKPYKNSNILESGIYYWELKYKSKQKGVSGEKIGILWFTFNRKVTANPNTEPYGILVRSKNMQMGDHNTLADAIFRSKSDDYIATFRELTQTLQGVYGEMLIHSPRLDDNARRDWFRIDTASIELRNIIVEFMKHLHTYRNVASKAFNAIENDKNREKLTIAFTELTANYEPKEFLEAFYQSKNDTSETIIVKEEKMFEYAEDDIPYASVNIKRFYDRLISFLKGYYSEKGDPQEFIKLRSFIKKKLSEEHKK